MLNDPSVIDICRRCLSQKIERFKKNIIASIQKITINLQNGNQQFKANLKKSTTLDSSEEKTQTRKLNKTKPIIKKSKNSKISSQKSVYMVNWLLKNFENPYPTTEQKIQMAKLSETNVNQVNNWFINARERTIKSYFIKEVKQF